MKKNITITIDDEFLPNLYALLNKERMAAQELMNDDKFATEYPALTRRARITAKNLTDVCNLLLDEI